MASINKVILIGNLGRDPELRYMPSGSAICTLKIATSRNWKDKNTGERAEETEWHSVVLFDRLAEIASEYLKKGRSVYIEGRLKTRKWQDKEGQDRYTTEVVAENMQLLGGRDSAGGGSGGGDDFGGGYDAAPAPRAPAARPAARPAAPMAAPAASRPAPAPKAPTSFDDMDDDIPF